MNAKPETTALPAAALAHQSTRKMRLIMNNMAAQDEAVRDAVHQVREWGHHVDVRLIWEPGDGAFFAQEAAQQGFDVVLAAGGDGTLNEIINGVTEEANAGVTCMVGALPFGTANDFAMSCGLPLDDPFQAMKQAARAEAVPIDLGVVNGRRFINVASGGYAAEITTESSPEMKRLLGGFAYFLTGLASAADITARHTHFKAPDFEWEGDILALAVSNGRQAGGGFHVAPRARLNDGLLDVLIVPATNWREFNKLLNDLQDLKTEQHLEKLIYLQTPWLEVSSEEGLQVNADGEPLYSQHFRFDCRPQALRFFLEPHSEACAPLLSRNEAPCRIVPALGA